MDQFEKGECEMSYDVSLENAGPVERFVDGGTYPVGGTDDPELNITYNYAEVYQIFGFSINDLHGKRAGDFIEKFDEIVTKCGTKSFTDYWAPTPGNAGVAIARLLAWAKQYPDATFRVS
jgi:hypothetical protein